MAVISSHVDTNSAEFAENQAHMDGLVSQLHGEEICLLEILLSAPEVTTLDRQEAPGAQGAHLRDGGFCRLAVEQVAFEVQDARCCYRLTVNVGLKQMLNN